MYTYYHYILTIAALCASSAASSRITIDSIKAVSYGESTSLITDADIRRPGIDGRMRPIEEMVRAEQMFQESSKFFANNKDEVKKRLESLEKENGMTHEDMKSVFSGAGYTYEEGLRQFEMMTANNQLVGMKVAGKIYITDDEIKAYHTKNSILLEPCYCLQTSFIGKEAGKDINTIKAGLKSKSLIPVWNEPYWTDKSEIDNEKAYIFRMKSGQMHVESLPTGGFLCLRLVEKKDERPKELDKQREFEIENILRQEKFMAEMGNHQKELREKNSVILF